MMMGYARYIGRVGALAVALGIGAGMAATPWVASAKPSDSSSSPSKGTDVSVSDGGSGVQVGATSSVDGKGSVAIANDESSVATVTGGPHRKVMTPESMAPASSAGLGRDNPPTVTDNNSYANPGSGNGTKASAAASVTRPAKANGTGRIHVDTATGAVTGEESGVMSHLGKYTLGLEGTASPSADGTIAGSGTATITGANGDQLTATYTLTGQDPTLNIVVTITGGTGRFANASGTLTVICDETGAPRLEEQILIIEHECKTEGQINY